MGIDVRPVGPAKDAPNPRFLPHVLVVTGDTAGERGVRAVMASAVDRVPRSRAALAEDVRRIRDAEGLPWREIAQRLGISTSYASELGTDPLGEKTRARKESYRGECVDCGAPTSGSDGAENAPKRCAKCHAIRQHEEREWTPETIVLAFRAAAEILGRPPAAADFTIRTPSTRRKMTPTRIAEGEKLREAMDAGLRFPPPSVVKRECGSWDAALDLAGLSRASGRGGAPWHREPARPHTRFWTRDRIVTNLTRIAQILERPFVYNDLRPIGERTSHDLPPDHVREIEIMRAVAAAEDLAIPCVNTVIDEFSGITAAREACGLPEPKRRQRRRR